MVRCKDNILRANVARYQWHPPRPRGRRGLTPNLRHNIQSGSLRDGRSFADAVNGNSNSPSTDCKTNPPRIIANNYGKVIDSENYFVSRKDLSFARVGVLSALRRKINDEISVFIDGCNYRIGVMEIDDDWSPFNSASEISQDLSDEDDDDNCSDQDEDDRDEISDTWDHNSDDLEDGEIPANQDGEISADHDDGITAVQSLPTGMGNEPISATVEVVGSPRKSDEIEEAHTNIVNLSKENNNIGDDEMDKMSSVGLKKDPVIQQNEITNPPSSGPRNDLDASPIHVII
ncbi:hypothetical protein L2E82_05566 [Cichorium intybus]|uniref:Uncharacterized protein n=1 Tax=Cichorium intybus TaxID=13427 RepID=A0ACB9H962_CICIN|nr:hypothetical protein L2E82_05566 [Cichorium intybus]